MTQRKHTPIYWGKCPEHKTPFGDTNDNHMDEEIPFEDNRPIPSVTEIQKSEILYKINNLLKALPIEECTRVYGYLSTLYSSEGGKRL
jgi:hypothetical protein